MIHITEKYGIDVSDRCYVVGPIARQTNKKTGEEGEIITNGSYYPTFEGALRHVRRKIHMDAVRNTDGNLDAALAAIRVADERFAEVISGIDEPRRTQGNEHG